MIIVPPLGFLCEAYKQYYCFSSVLRCVAMRLYRLYTCEDCHEMGQGPYESEQDERHQFNKGCGLDCSGERVDSLSARYFPCPHRSRIPPSSAEKYAHSMIAAKPCHIYNIETCSQEDTKEKESLCSHVMLFWSSFETNDVFRLRFFVVEFIIGP